MQESCEILTFQFEIDMSMLVQRLFREQCVGVGEIYMLTIFFLSSVVSERIKQNNELLPQCCPVYKYLNIPERVPVFRSYLNGIALHMLCMHIKYTCSMDGGVEYVEKHRNAVSAKKCFSLYKLRFQCILYQKNSLSFNNIVKKNRQCDNKPQD